MLTATAAEGMLRQAGLRVTGPRVAVLRAVHEHPHAETEAVIAATRGLLPEVSHQAVYDTLHRLTELGLLRCIQPKGTLARYETRIGDNHHHAICRGCGTIVDIDCAIGAAPCLTPSDDHGFAIEHAEVVYWGLCADCRAAGTATAASASSP